MQKDEIIQLVISWITISLAFSMGAVFTRGFLPAFTTSFPIILFTLGIGFIFHELGHRWMAKRFGCIAFYRMWVPGLALALGLAIMTGGRMIFAAPGAVLIGGKHLTLREEVIIVVVGPVTNMIAGTLFLLLGMWAANNALLLTIGNVGAYVNFFLAAFNLIPFPPLDGHKVLQWNPLIWITAIGISGAMIIL